MAIEGDGSGDEQSKGFTEEWKQLGFTTACQQQWQRTVEHANAYPYVWASYAVVYGGLSIYGSWRWRQLRKTENEVLRIQRELLESIRKQETVTSHVVKESQPLASPSEQLRPDLVTPSNVPVEKETERPPLKA